MMRLNKLLSAAGIASRRAADELIQQGRVEINGRVVRELGTKADLEHDEIRVDGRRLRRAPERRYLLMNKPAGVVSTRSDPQRRPTIADLLAKAGIDGYFYPVGRLDYDTEGLLLITNDGELAERASHPRYGLPRTYEARVEGVPDDRDLDRLRRGVLIDGRKTQPARVHVVRVAGSKRGPQAILEMTIHEGRNRQVRRMCDAIAHPVSRLRRTRFGPITDARLGPGELRELTPHELRALRDAVSGSGLEARGARREARGSSHEGEDSRKPKAQSRKPRAPSRKPQA
jgi:23S rRNA pseudouridine2605 synthase